MPRFEDLWTRAADDGASCPVSVCPSVTAAEVDQLMTAWYRERSQRIEGALLLDQARRLLAGLMAEGAASPDRRRQAGRLLRAIRSHQLES